MLQLEAPRSVLENLKPVALGQSTNLFGEFRGWLSGGIKDSSEMRSRTNRRKKEKDKGRGMLERTVISLPGTMVGCGDGADFLSLSSRLTIGGPSALRITST